MAEQPVRGGASWGVQGCLIAAVALFIVLLLALVFIIYQQLRTPPEPLIAPTPAGVIHFRP